MEQAGSFVMDSVVREIFQQLEMWSQQEKFDDDFLETLISYHKACPESEVYEFRLAQYAMAQGNFSVALDYALMAYQKRKCNFAIWQVLLQCYQKCGKSLEALFFEGLCCQHYDIPLRANLPKSSMETYLQVLSCAMSDPRTAPFLLGEMYYDQQDGLRERSNIVAGKFLPHIPGDDSEYAYWVGIYNLQNLLNVRGDMLEAVVRRGMDTEHSYCDLVFDVMKSKVNRCLRIDSAATYVLPLAGTVSSQPVELVSDEVNGTIHLGKYEYTFFRLQGKAEFVSALPFSIGKPILLQHSPKRKKVILNILVDALSWGHIKKEKYQLIPHIMRFFSRGIIFDHSYSVAEYTYPSLATIETGRNMQHIQIFNPKVFVQLKDSYKTISEKMSEAGYYCTNLMGDGSGIFNGVTRGYDRLLVNQYSMLTFDGVERVIRQLEAFSECDQFILLHVNDVHPNSASFQQSLKAQTKVSMEKRLETVNDTVSVLLAKTYMNEYQNQENIRMVDRQLGSLFSYLQQNYREDEYIVHLYSDHGASVYSEKPWFLSEEQCGSALMMRGAGIPQRGIVNELVSTLDIYPIVMRNAGMVCENDVDGNLPKVLGGQERSVVFSNSIYPGQTFKLCIRSQDYEFRLETEKFTGFDGMVDFSRIQYEVYTRDLVHEVVRNDAVKRYFLRLAEEYTRSFSIQRFGGRLFHDGE